MYGKLQGRIKKSRPGPRLNRFGKTPDHIELTLSQTIKVSALFGELQTITYDIQLLSWQSSGFSDQRASWRLESRNRPERSKTVYLLISRYLIGGKVSGGNVAFGGF
jgi:hypothetical protein